MAQFLTSALDEVEWPASRPGHFTSCKTASCSHCIRSLVGLRYYGHYGEDTKPLPLPGIERRFLCRLALNLVAVSPEISRLQMKEHY
jgi:hypothetical protein